MPGAVMYTFRPTGIWKLSSVAKEMAASGERYAPALLSTTVPFVRASCTSAKRLPALSNRRRPHPPHPNVPVTLYANGSGGLLERMGGTGADVIGLDWTSDIADARRRLGPNVAVQGNVDPVVLFGTEAAIEEAVMDCITKAGNKGHILNLGHGVLVGTPEENVAYMFDLSKKAKYAGVAAGV